MWFLNVAAVQQRKIDEGGVHDLEGEAVYVEMLDWGWVAGLMPRW